MKNIIHTSQFQRQAKALQKKHYDFKELQKILELLVEEKSLPRKYKDHALTGDWKSFREFHVSKTGLLSIE